MLLRNSGGWIRQEKGARITQALKRGDPIPQGRGRPSPRRLPCRYLSRASLVRLLVRKRALSAQAPAALPSACGGGGVILARAVRPLPAGPRDGPANPQRFSARQGKDQIARLQQLAGEEHLGEEHLGEGAAGESQASIRLDQAFNAEVEGVSLDQLSCFALAEAEARTPCEAQGRSSSDDDSRLGPLSVGLGGSLPEARPQPR